MNVNGLQQFPHSGQETFLSVCVGPVMLMSREIELHPLCDMHLIGFQDGVNAT